MPAAVEVAIEFDGESQSLSALNAAAYRLLGTASCHIDSDGSRYVCRLAASGGIDAATLRARYLDLITDENVREAVRQRTEPVRNLILSLAFGSLAAQQSNKP